MHRIIVICLVAAMLMIGCQSPQKKVLPVVTATATAETGAQSGSKNTFSIVDSLNKVSEQGDIVATVQEKNSFFIFVSKDEKNIIYHWNLENGKQIKRKLGSILVGNIDVQKNKGYYVFYDQNQKVVVTDANFKTLDIVNIKNSMLNGSSERNYCVLPGKKKIVYTREVLKGGQWYQEVIECVYKGKKKRQICKIEDVDKNIGKVNSISQLVPSEDEKDLFFTGLYFKTRNANETSSPCFGVINGQSGSITAVQEEKNLAHLMENTMVFTDGLKEKGVLSSGYITCLSETGTKKQYYLDKKEESQEVTVSDHGNYYIGYERFDDDRTELSGYLFKESGRKWKAKISHSVWGIWFFEDERMLLYSYYDENQKLCFGRETINYDK